MSMLSIKGSRAESSKHVLETPRLARIKKKPVCADVIAFSGCRDDQTSADAFIDRRSCGALSSALLKVLLANSSITYIELLMEIKAIIAENKFVQIPQLSCSREFDLNTRFSL